MALNLVFTVTDERTWGPGTILAGKYRVERVLGQGGMGVVVAAMHEQLQERVAVKLLRGERVAQREAVERVLREARATVKIQSDHVVRVFDVSTLEDGAPYIVMEYLAGCDLAQLLCAEGKLPVDDAASYVAQACDAIGKAHGLGIVHRDLKPANLFLAVRDEDASIKVLDFGISKMTADFEPALTGAAALLGSPTYMSPEQLESPRDVDERTDVWSLGVILYELVTGAHPFRGETFSQLAKQIADAPAPRLENAALDAIVQKCLAKRREDRYANGAELGAALAPLAGGVDRDHVPAFARTAMASERPSGVETRPARSEQGAKHEPALARSVGASRPRWMLPAVGGIAAAAAIGIGVVALSGGSKAAPAAPPPPAAAPTLAGGGVLACPQLQATVEGAPAGWLGAAASTIACTRAQARMGGHSARTLIPAELLDLPRVPVDGFPHDVYDAVDARQRQLAAGKARGAAWLDGSIARDRDHFHIELVVRAADGRELARGAGDDPQLVEAIRAAMEPFERTAIPSAPPGDKFLADWIGASTADAAVALVDFSYVRQNEFEQAEHECERVSKRTDFTPVTTRILGVVCGPPRAAVPTPMPARDTSSPAALRMSLELDPFEDRRALDPDVKLLDAALAKTTDHEERALLLAEESLLAGTHHQIDRGTALGIAALREDPKALDVFESNWSWLSFLRSESNLVPAANAWVPWSDEAYCMTSTQALHMDQAVRAARREHVLSPTSHLWTLNLVEWLVYDGKPDEAKTIATEVDDPGSRVLLAAADGKFAKAYDVAHEILPKYPDQAGMWAFNAAYYLAPVTLVVGKPAPDIEPLVKRYLDSDPSKISDNMLAQYSALVACVAAPHDVATRCLARLRVVSEGVIGNIDGVLEGAEKYVAGDYAGATLAWQPMLARQSWQVTLMRDYAATAFERVGRDDLVERIDAPYLEGRGRYNGADLAYVRAARREAKRGHTDEAKKWAQKVIDAWSVADLQVPAVAEMRKLVARLH